MKKQNITLSLPKELLRKVRMIAVEQETSISGLLAKTLEELVAKEDAYGVARTRHLKILASGFDLQTHGHANWNREQIHER